MAGTVRLQSSIVKTQFLMVWSFIFSHDSNRLAAKPRAPVSLCGFNVPWLLPELYRNIGYGVLGATASFLITDLSKFTVGRLRQNSGYSCLSSNTSSVLCLVWLSHQARALPPDRTSWRPATPRPSVKTRRSCSPFTLSRTTSSARDTMKQ